MEVIVTWKIFGVVFGMPPR